MKSNRAKRGLNVNGFKIDNIENVANQPILSPFVKVAVFIVLASFTALIAFQVIVKVKPKVTWLPKDLTKIGFSNRSRKRAAPGALPGEKFNPNARNEGVALLAKNQLLEKCPPYAEAMKVDEDEIYKNLLHEELSSELCTVDSVRKNLSLGG